LVIVLGAVTGIVALRSSVSAQTEARAIDSQIVVTERLRSRAREIVASGRRYMQSGDRKEQQRVLAIIDDLKRDRALLDSRYTLPYGPKVEATLDEYQLGLIDAMADFHEDPVERLTRFEDRVEKVRLPLSAAFDDLIAHERTRRSQLRSASSLGRSAQWTLLLASAIGVLLAIGLCVAVLRKLSRLGPAHAAAPNTRPALLRQPFDVTEVIEQAVSGRREMASHRGLRLRFEPQPGAVVMADRDRVREVLDNILDAAIVDGRPSSELVVHVGSAEGGVRVAVIEPGPNADATAADPVSLLLCRQIVEAHGGRLGIQSSAISRTYWFTLPAEPAVLR
jgi:signal transduction histidine kinase